MSGEGHRGTTTEAGTLRRRHYWRCDICHQFIHVGGARHRHCADDVERKAGRDRELMARVDALLERTDV